MNAPLPLESKLSLYQDTVCRDTGQYFCNSQPFSLPRAGNKVSMLQSGSAALREIHSAMMSAQSFIWIADWQMAFDVELVRRGDTKHPGRLHNIIKEIISTKSVHVRVLLYDSYDLTPASTHDNSVMKELNALNQKGYPGSVRVLQQSPTSAQNDSREYSHHQKFVVVDGKTAFIGGIDLTYGRWETPEYDVVVDPEHFVINDMYNPCATKLRPVSREELKKIEDFHFAEPYKKILIEEGCQPRMPWQDVHIKIEGPSVVDIHRNFARRWNMDDTKSPINKIWLKQIGGWELLTEMQPLKSGGVQVQIVRSVSNNHLGMEHKTRLDDLLLYPNAHEREMWGECLNAWQGNHQSNILNAMVNCIRSADIWYLGREDSQFRPWPCRIQGSPGGFQQNWQ
jgi:phospholipase D1/2